MHHDIEARAQGALLGAQLGAIRCAAYRNTGPQSVRPRDLEAASRPAEVVLLRAVAAAACERAASGRLHGNATVRRELLPYLPVVGCPELRLGFPLGIPACVAAAIGASPFSYAGESSEERAKNRWLAAGELIAALNVEATPSLLATCFAISALIESLVWFHHVDGHTSASFALAQALTDAAVQLRLGCPTDLEDSTPERIADELQGLNALMLSEDEIFTLETRYLSTEVPHLVLFIAISMVAAATFDITSSHIWLVLSDATTIQGDSMVVGMLAGAIAGAIWPDEVFAWKPDPFREERGLLRALASGIVREWGQP